MTWALTTILWLFSFACTCTGASAIWLLTNASKICALLSKPVRCEIGQLNLADSAIMETKHPSLAEIAAAITELFDKLPTRLGDGRTDREWTTQLKEDISSLGETHGWTICTSGFKERFDGEWLYDLIWYRNDSDNHLTEVYLVLESEWQISPSAIKYDFEKLLLAKATLKVMVFQSYEQDISGIFSLLERGICVFQKRSADETYILAGFNIDTSEFVVRQINGNQ